MQTVADIFNFRFISDRLSTAGQPTEAQLRAAATEGYEVIINLALHDHPRYSLPDEAGLVSSLGMQYVHIPVQFDDPQETDLLAFMRAMETYQNSKLLVHCAANMRVTAFLGLYQVLRQGVGEREAFEPMRAIWQPDAIWSSFIKRMLAGYRTA